jgi:hypothetical protein
MIGGRQRVQPTGGSSEVVVEMAAGAAVDEQQRWA